jgi:hypothetical protein
VRRCRSRLSHLSNNEIRQLMERLRREQSLVNELVAVVAASGGRQEMLEVLCAGVGWLRAATRHAQADELLEAVVLVGEVTGADDSTEAAC